MHQVQTVQNRIDDNLKIIYRIKYNELISRQQC